MKCYHCGKLTHRITTNTRKNKCHRCYLCDSCGKKTYTVESYVAFGPSPGSPRFGKIARGSRVASSVFTEEDILRMRELYASGMLQKDIASMFGTRQPWVSQVVNRKVWTHI